MTDTEVLIYNFKIHTMLGREPEVQFSLGTAMDIVNEIKERDAKIAQLEKEADWLASTCVSLYSNICSTVSAGDYINDPEMTVKYWREEAREVVKNG